MERLHKLVLLYWLCRFPWAGVLRQDYDWEGERQRLWYQPMLYVLVGSDSLTQGATHPFGCRYSMFIREQSSGHTQERKMCSVRRATSGFRLKVLGNPWRSTSTDEVVSVMLNLMEDMSGEEPFGKHVILHLLTCQ